MIRCAECKHYESINDHVGIGNCSENEDPKVGMCTEMLVYKFQSCIHAERADGLTECCETCKHLFDYDDCNAIECKLEQFDYTSRACLNVKNMSCPEWQAREGK